MKELLDRVFPTDAQHLIELFELMKIEDSEGMVTTLQSLVEAKAPAQGFSDESEVLDAYNQIAQQYLLRKKGSERWDIKDNAFLRENHELIMNKLRALGFVDEVKPKLKDYDYVFLLGALESTVVERRKHLERLMESGTVEHASSYVLLGGKRPLMEGKEPCAQLKDVDTELDMMLHDWNNHGSIDSSPIKVDAPLKADGSRPNTQDTIESFLKLPDVKAQIKAKGQLGSVLVVSNQPFVQRQDLVVKAVLPANTTVHTVGASASQSLSIGVLLDSLARFIYQTQTNLKLTKQASLGGAAPASESPLVHAYTLSKEQNKKASADNGLDREERRAEVKLKR